KLGKGTSDNSDDKTNEPPTRSEFQAAAAIAVDVETNSAVARIGDGTTSDSTDLAQVNAGGTITVNSRVKSTPSLTATASAQTDNKSFATPDKSKTFTGTANYGVTLAVTFGDYHNSADADISGNAIVSANGALTVDADSLNAFNPQSTWGTNLASFGNASTYTAKFDTTQGTRVLHEGDTVSVPSSYNP